MDSAKYSEFSEIATRAIFESLSPNRRELGDYTKKAIFHASDVGFREIIDAIARGMGLSVICIGHHVGLVLRIQDDNSPFSPGLTWLGNRLSHAQHNKDELHCFAVLTLTALLSEAFPSSHAIGIEWSSPAQFNVEDILNSLHDLANETVNQTQNSKESDKNVPISLAKMVVESRIPKYPQVDKGRISALRSQQELIKSWIHLLEEHGLLIEEQGYQEEDVRWMATEKLKIYIGQASITPLAELLMTIEESTDEDIAIDLSDKAPQSELFDVLD